VRALRTDQSPEEAVLSLRPHVCPNCANDLAVEERAVVFHCDSCERAWLVEGDRLEQVPCAVAAPPTRIPEREVDYYPFWETSSEDAAGAPRIVPAFRHASLARLNDLALALSRRRDRLDLGATGGHGGRSLRGCELDADDAAALAAFFAHAGESPAEPPGPSRRHPTSVSLGGRRARLLWLPFVRDAYGWREPTTGIALLPALGA
jgi:hypothetical protein